MFMLIYLVSVGDPKAADLIGDARISWINGSCLEVAIDRWNSNYGLENCFGYKDNGGAVSYLSGEKERYLSPCCFKLFCFGMMYCITHWSQTSATSISFNKVYWLINLFNRKIRNGPKLNSHSNHKTRRPLNHFLKAKGKHWSSCLAGILENKTTFFLFIQLQQRKNSSLVEGKLFCF